ncbi:arylsulfatase B [Planctomyces sp. SH-PL62]|uniref:arylsulfatase B n=1 Tax=Planctomyces sp. SH-PL62 TaxID=1636152 RepID=UPI00078BCCBA|nr:arylsulfatase [Planctomyces sp. SH-PL62]AMV37661.1 Arylsulfatase [Planctomyces sp. SH-PL62]
MPYRIAQRFLLGLVSLAGCFAVGAPEAGAQDSPRPHIVHIVSDDQGWRDVGFHGSPDIRTPNLDRLAAGGARLERFYVAPLCTPTRAALLTGRYPFRYGLQSFVIPASGTYGLATDEWLLPQALKEAGYDTAIVGKWHVGHADPKFRPHRRGFDHQYGYFASEIDYFTHEVMGVPDWWRNGEPVREEGYSTTLLGDEAVRIIRDHDPARPLYLYLAFNAPHTPYQAPQDDLDRYAAIADPSRRTYAAMVAAMDDQIGRVVEALDRSGMRERTLILFHSDNGGLRDPKIAGQTPARPVADNGPLRGGKGSLYEGGSRVVALANWPGRIKAGGTVDGLIHVVDLYPTFVTLAGGRLDRGKPLDGLDVWATIHRGEPSPRTEVVYNIEPSAAGLRRGDWKLVWHPALPPTAELYNLAEDPYETTDLAAKHPDQVAALQGRVIELAAEMTPPLFTPAAIEATLKLPPVLPSGGP